MHFLVFANIFWPAFFFFCRNLSYSFLFCGIYSANAHNYQSTAADGKESKQWNETKCNPLTNVMEWKRVKVTRIWYASRARMNIPFLWSQLFSFFLCVLVALLLSLFCFCPTVGSRGAGATQSATYLLFRALTSHLLWCAMIMCRFLVRVCVLYFFP